MVPKRKVQKTKVKVISFRLERNIFAGSHLISCQDDFLFVNRFMNFIIKQATITLEYENITISNSVLNSRKLVTLYMSRSFDTNFATLESFVV